MAKYDLTSEGLELLKKELEGLLVRRNELIDLMNVAREQGDLRENSEFRAAENERGIVEQRILDIQKALKSYNLIDNDHSKVRACVALGDIVQLVSTMSGREKLQVSIVGTLEADPLKGKISNKSPLGKALLGKRLHDNVSFSQQGAEVVYKIVSIK